MGGSPAETRVQGIPSPSISPLLVHSIPLPHQHSSVPGHTLSQPEELLSLQNNPTKTPQLMSNFHSLDF